MKSDLRLEVSTPSLVPCISPVPHGIFFYKFMVNLKKSCVKIGSFKIPTKLRHFVLHKFIKSIISQLILKLCFEDTISMDRYEGVFSRHDFNILLLKWCFENSILVHYHEILCLGYDSFHFIFFIFFPTFSFDIFLFKLIFFYVSLIFIAFLFLWFLKKNNYFIIILYTWN